MDTAPLGLPDSSVTMPEFLAADAQRRGRRVSLAVGQHLLHCGQGVDVFAVLVRGVLRVYANGANGREITLYSVAPGECCMINVMCLIAGVRCPAAAVAEEPAAVILFPRRTFLDWLDQRTDFRAYVFGIMADRVGAMMALVEEVAFQRLDCRLAAYLCQRAGGDGRLATTHDAIAADLGTAREVVSRLLKSFERRGAVALGRGSIRVKNATCLRDLAVGAGASPDHP